MIDIINAYVEAGHQCVLLTGRLVQRNTALDPTVKIESIIRYNRTTTLKRFTTWIVGFLQILFKVMIKYRRGRLFIVSNPPLSVFLPRIVKNPFQLLIFDIYPDVLTELGYLSDKSFIIRQWIKSNKKVFPRAESIFTITESMKKVLRNYTSEVKVVPLWTSEGFFKPIDQPENAFVQKHGLMGKFIVLYSGNIGLAGDVEVLIDVAAKIQDDDIVFLIIGEGASKQSIVNKADKLKLKNVRFLPWQPVEELPFSLASASVAVISLGVKTSKLAIPSKLYNFLSVGVPLLCLASKDSEVAGLVEKYQCGESFEPNEINRIINFVYNLKMNRELYNSMKKNSFDASKDFNIVNVKKFL
jgi:hypothetical protein